MMLFRFILIPLLSLFTLRSFSVCLLIVEVRSVAKRATLSPCSPCFLLCVFLWNAHRSALYLHCVTTHFRSADCLYSSRTSAIRLRRNAKKTMRSRVLLRRRVMKMKSVTMNKQNTSTHETCLLHHHSPSQSLQSSSP